MDRVFIPSEEFSEEFKNYDSREVGAIIYQNKKFGIMLDKNGKSKWATFKKDLNYFLEVYVKSGYFIEEIKDYSIII